MSETPRPADLRLTIPADAPYPELAGEVAAKFAEYSGADAPAAGRLARDVRTLVTKLAAKGEITFTMDAVDRQLRVSAAAGARSEQAVIPL